MRDRIPNVEAFIGENLDGTLLQKAIALGVKSILELITAITFAAALVAPTYGVLVWIHALEYQILQLLTSIAGLGLAFFQTNVACRFGTTKTDSGENS